MNLKKIVTGVAIAAAMAFSSSAYAWKLVVINDTETQVDAVYFRNKNTNMQPKLCSFYTRQQAAPKGATVLDTAF